MLQFTFCYCVLKSRPDNYYFMPRTSLTVPFILLSTLLSTLSNAQSELDKEERWFQTEIIVFEIREKSTRDSQEIWPDDPGLPNYENSIELSAFIDAKLQKNIKLGADENPLLSTPVISENRLEIDNNTPKLLVSAEIDDLTPTDMPHTTPVTELLIETPLPQEQPFQLLPDDALTLTELVETLTDSVKYVPILNIAWRQPVASKEAAQAIYIHSNLEQITLTTTPDLSSINTLMAPPSLSNTPMLLIAQNEANIPSTKETSLKTLAGTIKIHLGRYLHLEADLLYRSQIEPLKNNTFFMNFDEIKQPQTLFRMHQKRRLRSGELHYFDHPMFGLLVKIIPYALPKPEIELKENSEPDAALIEENTETDGTTIQ